MMRAIAVFIGLVILAALTFSDVTAQDGRLEIPIVYEENVVTTVYTITNIGDDTAIIGQWFSIALSNGGYDTVAVLPNIQLRKDDSISHAAAEYVHQWGGEPVDTLLIYSNKPLTVTHALSSLLPAEVYYIRLPAVIREVRP